MIKSWTQPTADEIERLRALGARAENRAYFFDRLENPLWVEPLASEGFFDDPPPAVPAGEPGYVRFPLWPEGRYLARVASAEPDAVAGAIRELAPNGNPTIARLWLEAFTALSDDQVRRLSTRLPIWLKESFAEHFLDEGVAAIVRVFDVGQVGRGLQAVATLLRLEPDPIADEKSARADTAYRPRPEPSARLSEWNYERAATSLADLVVDRAGIQGLRLLTSLLDEAIRLSRWGESDEDLSYLWRPAIEDHAQNVGRTIRDHAISATRDGALRLAARSDDDFEVVMDELDSGSTLHHRIALHVLAAHNGASALVDARIRDRALFDDHRLRHEYAGLLQRRFGDAITETREQLLSWIREGPDLAEYRRSRTRFDGVAPSDEDVERYALLWRRDWFSFIALYLEGEDANAYADLVRDLGPPEHPDFLSWSSSWVGPQSPLDVNDLAQQSIDEVIEFLRGWKPEDSRFGPSIEGLGRAFAEDVQARPQDYARVAPELVDVDPTYVRSFFSGLDKALREEKAFDWDGPLILAEAASANPFEADEEVDDWDRDPGWRWCRREIAGLLRSGLSDRDNRIPFSHREAVWPVIERLADDPNPSPAHEQRYGGDNMDPLTLSINTNRGTAMHAVIEYGLWTRRELEAVGEDVSRGFELMPEVRQALERHLDAGVDPSVAVRAVYGRWLPWLLLLDEAWLLDHVDEILPADQALTPLRDAAWGTYIAWCPPYNSTFRALRAAYADAVGRVPSGRTAGRFDRESQDVKLGEHLATFFWRGAADSAAVEAFFERADDELAANVMEFVGRALRNTAGEIEEPVRIRIQELWDARVRVALESPERHLVELQTFGVSFASGKLDTEWSRETLERTVAFAGAPRLGHLVVERLLVVSQTNPAAAARVLAAMLDRPHNEWDHVTWRDEAKAIVVAAVDSDGQLAAESCAQIVDFYVTRGYLEFRDLIRPR